MGRGFDEGGLAVWWWSVALIVAAAAIAGYTAILNARPARCPLCRRVNLFRRSRSGERRDERDDEGALRRALTPFRCGFCGGHYWMVWDDFAGTSATVALPQRSDSEPSGPKSPGADGERGAGA